MRRGDRVLLMLGNQVELWESMLAVMKLGAVILPTTTVLAANDLADRVERGQVRHVLEILGLSDDFDVVATRGDVGRGKPDPEIDLLVARKLGVKPPDCLVFEDSPAGVEAALAAGMKVIAVTTDLTRQKFEDTDLRDRCQVVDDPRELSNAVRRVIPEYGG